MKRHFHLLAIVLLFAAVPAAAQVNVPRWGSSTCATSGCDGSAPMQSSVAVAVGPYMGQATDLHLEFPIFNRATDGSAQLQAVLVYDSQFWQENGSSWLPQTGNGWWLRTVGGQLLETDQFDYGACGWTNNDGEGDDGSGEIDYYTYTLTEPDGSSEPAGTVMEASGPSGLHNEGQYWDCPTGDTLPETFGITDGKGFDVIADGSYDSGVTATAWDGAGDEVDDGFTDRNGNVVKETSGTYSDPLGAALSVSGSGTSSSPIVYTYTGVNGAQENTTVSYETAYASANFGCFTGWSGYLNLPKSIAYPDGETYTFTYDSQGRLASVTQPTGATLSYSSYLAVQCTPFYITDSLTQSDSLDSGVNWNWQHDTSTNQLVQTDPYFNDTVSTFAAAT
ncbi:MAG: RHS repeat domain-containing protein [Terriglobales bacterium]